MNEVNNSPLNLNNQNQAPQTVSQVNNSVVNQSNNLGVSPNLVNNENQINGATNQADLGGNLPVQNNQSAQNDFPEQGNYVSQNNPPIQNIPDNLPKKKKSKILFLIAFIFLIFLILSVFSNGNSADEKNESTNSQFQEQPVEKEKETNMEEEVSEFTDSQNSCQIMWVDPVFPENGEIEALFMREPEKITPKGYEGIIRRSVTEDGYIDVDIVTNGLPEEEGPYYVFALGVNPNREACFSSNIGQLEKIEGVPAWGSGSFYLPLEDVNDAQFFVITGKNFGAKSTDKIKSLDDSSIILYAAYAENRTDLFD